MREQLDNLFKIIDSVDSLQGCISGSYFLDDIEGQDLDLFVYNETSLIRILEYCRNSDLFIIDNDLEQWKLDSVFSAESSFRKQRMISVKFLYNTCVYLNIVYKNNMRSIFDILSNFDLSILCKGYDLETKKMLDLSEKECRINTWNLQYKSTNLLTSYGLFRQITRVIKYYKRGYNTDKVTLEYIDFCNRMLIYDGNFFKSESFKENILYKKAIIIITKYYLLEWLNTHEISEDDFQALLIITDNISTYDSVKQVSFVTKAIDLLQSSFNGLSTLSKEEERLLKLLKKYL